MKNKLLHQTKLKCNLQNWPKLFIYPAKSKINNLKKCLKTLIKYNQNRSAYFLISILNPIIIGWVGYYSFSNAFGVFNLLRYWLYNRIVLWMKQKHPKSSIIWLNKQYLIIKNKIEQYILKNDPKAMKYISNFKSIDQIQKNRWNFFGITWQKIEKSFYKIPRINVLLWPTNIKKIKLATIFVPKKEILISNFYLKQEKWLNEHLKLEYFYKTKKKNFLLSLIWDNEIYFICNILLFTKVMHFENSIEFVKINTSLIKKFK